MKKVKSMFIMDGIMQKMCESAIAYHADKGDLNAEEAIMALDVFVALLDVGGYVMQNTHKFAGSIPKELIDRLLELMTIYDEDYLDSLDD